MEGIGGRIPQASRRMMVSPNLPDDILINILARLPCKSLYRFKCASKHLYSLIHDEIHRNPVTKTVTGLIRNDAVSICRGSKEWVSKYVGSVEGCGFPSFLSCGLGIITCCNGLLLCKSFLAATRFYVCNPSTKRWKWLREPTQLLQDHAHKFVLAFDPCVSPHYKVIRFQIPVQGQSAQLPIKFDVFDSKKRSWSAPKAFPASSRIQLWGGGLSAGSFVGGSLYLTAHRGVVRFDLSEENYQVVKLPFLARGKYVSKWALKHNIVARGVYVGNLWFASCDGFQLKIWILQDWSTSKWALKHSISAEALGEKSPQGFHPHPLCNKLKVLAFHPHLEAVFLQMGLQIFSYNINSSVLENPFNLESEDLYSTVETFVPEFGIFPFSPCRIDFA